MAKGVDPDMSFLNKFFRNLLLGEHHELKNRYMLINPPEEWKTKNEENSDRPSTDQVDRSSNRAGKKIDKGNRHE